MQEQITEQSSEQKQNGWEDETNKYAELARKFLKENWNNFYQDDGLEFSGGGVEVMGNVQQGSVIPDKVTVLYEDGKIMQIHILFETQYGHDLDAYLTRRALEEFLKNPE